MLSGILKQNLKFEMMKMKLCVTLLMVVQFAFGQNRIELIDSVLQTMHANHNFNGNVLLAEGGEIIYQQSFGYANEETKQKLDENSIFELASVSKQFTAMAIMLLKEKGKLALDDEIAKHIPELGFYKGVTIRNLLNHTGGLPDYMGIMDSIFDKSKIATNKDIISIFSEKKPEKLFEPNSKYEYSNTGYALLASIIEKTSGMTYADYLQKNIFDPLKMTRTFVYTRRYAPKKVENYAFGYVHSDRSEQYILPDELDETKMVIWLDGIVGDGCVNSTVVDLLKWDRALYNEQLISRGAMNEVFKVAVLKDLTSTNYGFGWGVDDSTEFGKVVSHGGGWPGYVTYIERHLTNDKTIIILQNHDNVSIPAKSIRYILYNKPLPKPKVRNEISLTDEQLNRYVGVYEIEKDFVMTVSILEHQLYVQRTGQNAIPIYAEDALSFFLKVVEAQIRFEENEKGEIIKLFLLQNGDTIEANRVD